MGAKTALALTNWQVLDPSEFSSGGGATLTKTESKSILATGRNPSNDTYTVTAAVGPGRITGLRLEVLETGEEKEMGRHQNGGFVLTKFEVTAKPKDVDASQAVPLKNATADFSQKGYEVTNVLTGTGQGWAVGHRAHEQNASLATSPWRSLWNSKRHADLHVRHSEPAAAQTSCVVGLLTVGRRLGRRHRCRVDILLFSARRPARANDKHEPVEEYFQSIVPELKAIRDELRPAQAEADWTKPSCSLRSG